MSDPVHELTHDHGDLNRRVRELGSLLDGGAVARPNRDRIATILRDLREQLFLHFAREEEGLFPFVADRLPDLGERVGAMAIAHDAICGSLARMVHIATTGEPMGGVGAEDEAAELAAPPGELALLGALFERFEAAYADHARREAELLGLLDDRLDGAQRAQLAELVRDL
jgi:hypothetical protein